MNTHEILKAARAKIERPECWTQESLRRDACGQPCGRREAVCWCSMGAIYDTTLLGVADGAFSALKSVCGDNIADFNDTHTHAEVLEAFDKAIEATAP